MSKAATAILQRTSTSRLRALVGPRAQAELARDGLITAQRNATLPTLRHVSARIPTGCPHARHATSSALARTVGRTALRLRPRVTTIASPAIHHEAEHGSGHDQLGHADGPHGGAAYAEKAEAA